MRTGAHSRWTSRWTTRWPRRCGGKSACDAARCTLHCPKAGLVLLVHPDGCCNPAELKHQPVAHQLLLLQAGLTAATLLRLVEESDLKAAQELFGGQDLKDIKLEDFVPRTAKDFETLGRLLALTCA